MYSQVEDFLNSSTTTALSSVPIQVLIYVYNETNCSMPQITSPQVRLGVSVNVTCTTTLYAQDFCGPTVNISDINVQSFPGVVKGNLTLMNGTNNSLYSMTISYTPSDSQLGPQMLCTSALDRYSAQKVLPVQYFYFVLTAWGQHLLNTASHLLSVQMELMNPCVRKCQRMLRSHHVLDFNALSFRMQTTIVTSAFT